ncbi:Glutarate-semialdehyde dehydrogenase DavD [Pseudomonas fluorescens]|uniref:DavD_2 protein n=1 Tax=Pseudomonas fluorescens TaxID=294 RepID=A0A0D0TL18_PSEFL|nr:Glutarate-semialdehyde dehydrogenase [Pseudomonas synxantha]KIR21550.1 Glutarate-semialdehyde dehydrogenase DavD [Pseudomonas fluorescens]
MVILCRTAVWQWLVFSASAQLIDKTGVSFITNKVGIARKLFSTGSTEVSRQLMAQCAKDIRKVSLELGGNARS